MAAESEKLYSSPGETTAVPAGNQSVPSTEAQSVAASESGPNPVHQSAYRGDSGTFTPPNSVKLGTPTDRGSISSPVENFRESSGRAHKGIDIAVPIGTDVKATHDGTIIKAETIRDTSGGSTGLGIYIKSNDDSYQTRYLHLSQIIKSSGAVVKGEVIGKSGAYGSGPHLHFELREGSQTGSDNAYANPLDYFETSDGNYTLSPRGVGESSITPEEKVTQINKLTEPFFVRYNEQGILLKAREFIKNFKSKDKNGDEVLMSELPYKNFVKIKTDENPAIATKEITNLISPKGFKELMKISNAAASKLIPYIRIYRTRTKEENDEIEDVEFLFESNFANPEGKTRNYGYGLKEFIWNDNSFSHEGYSFDASLTIRFDSLSSFCKKRVGPKFINGVRKKNKEYSFMQLVYNLDLQDVEKEPDTHRVNDEADSQQDSQGEYSRVKIVVGWNPIKGDDREDPIYDAALKKKRVFYAYTTKHDVKINKDGTCDLVLNMQLAQDRESKDRLHANILRGKKSAEEALEPLRMRAEEAQKAAVKSQQDADNTAESSQNNLDSVESANQAELIAKKEYENKIIQQNKNIFSQFLNQMFNNNAIRCIKISKQSLDSLRERGMDSEMALSSVRIKEIEEFSVANQAKTKTFRLDSALEAQSIFSKDDAQNYYDGDVIPQEQAGDVFIPFFFLGDLLDVILNNVNEDKPESKKLKLLVGPVILRDLTQKTFIEAAKNNNLFTPNDKDAKTINLADLPISFRFFMDWWLTTVPRDASFTFTFQQFLYALENQFLPLILNPYCFGKRYVGGETKFNALSLTAVKGENNNDPLIEEPKFRGAILEAKQISNLVDGFVGENGSPNIVQYFYIDSRYEIRNQDGIKADEIANANEGIYHLKMGAKLGLVKNITFTKEDMPYVSEANWHKEGKLGAGQFKFAYRATCDMIGNIIFRPGMLVYVDPTFMLSGINKKDATRMGFNAFYNVIKTTNTLGVNGFRTSLQLKQVYPASE